MSHGDGDRMTLADHLDASECLSCIGLIREWRVASLGDYGVREQMLEV